MLTRAVLLASTAAKWGSIAGMGRALWAILALAVGAARGGDDQISRIRARVAERTARIPNYTCLETIERRWYRGEHAASQVLDRLRIEVAVVEDREQFAWPGESGYESSELQEVLRRGVTKYGDFAGFLSGIFVTGAATYTLVGEQPANGRRAIRYDYRVPKSSGYIQARDGVRAVIGYHGSFWVDPETLELTRLEIEGDDIPVELKTPSVKLAIDYGLVAVGAGNFLLPETTDVRVTSDHGLESRTVTGFSGCRQFVAESSISFGEQPVEQEGKQGGAGAELPAGVTLEAEWAAPIDRKTAAAGDVVQARLRKGAKTKGGILIPKGAVLQGRILRLETWGSARPCDMLAVRFTKIRFGGTQLGLRAVVIEFSTGRRERSGSLDWAGEYMHQISPGSPMFFWGGFSELPAGLPLTLRTVESR